MEITEINMISDFQAGMKCLQSPSLISRFFSFQVYSFWKWGALVLFAIFATFGSLIRRIKLVLIRFHTVKPSSIKQDEIIEFSDSDYDDDDDDDDISLSSSEDDDDVDEQEGRENRQTTSFRSQRLVDENCSVKGRRSCGGAWSDFAPGKSVVKLWDSLGLSIDFDEDLFNFGAQSVVSTWDSERVLKKNEFSGGSWESITAAAGKVFLTAGCNRKGDGVVLGGYDTRMRRRVPAIYAEWSAPSAGEEATAGGVGKVYVRDGVSGVLTAVGDVRNVRRPLESVRESDGETWWDADAVISEDEF